MKLEAIAIDTPIGTLTVVTHDEVLCTVALPGRTQQWRRALARRFDDEPRQRHGPHPLRAPFEAWFAGELDALDDLELDAGGTPFFRHVWEVLRASRPGTTMSYRDLALAAGRPAAVRAVAAANARNPLPLVVPCHRVIGSDGHLCGYGGGLECKRWLLAHEGVAVDRDGFLARAAHPIAAGSSK